MRPRRKIDEPRGDAGVATIGALLAAAAAAFAAIMVYVGPLRPGSDFNLIDLAANRENQRDASLEGDPIITGSLPAQSIVTSPRDLPGWFGEPGRPINYRLRSATGGSALVDVSSGPAFFTYKVETGGTLPGLGRVDSISFENGDWQIRTARSRISSRGAVLMGKQDSQ